MIIHVFLIRYLSAAFLIISSSIHCYCEIKNIELIEDSRPLILFERFGFAPEGHVDISGENITLKSKVHEAKLNPSSMGFFLVSDGSHPRILNESSYTEGFCVLSSRFVVPVYRFHNLNADSTFNTSVVIHNPDEYNLVFGNCQTEFYVSMNVHTEMYNKLDGGGKDFLPAGEIPLPKLYFVLFVTYTMFFITWVFICVKQKPNVQKIHMIMLVLLLFKALRLICASEDKIYIRNTGTPHGWDIAFYIFGFLKGVTLFTVIILIGTGWSFLKPYLQDREKSVLMFLIPLQVLEHIASVVITESGPVKKDWVAWNEMFLIIDVVCCFTILIPIFWSIRNLREASKTDGKAAKNIEKLTLFQRFYIVVAVYLYFTRIVVSTIGGILQYTHLWVSVAIAEGASFIFYLFIFSNFRPLEKNPYLVIDDQEEASVFKLSQEDDGDSMGL